MKKLLMTLALLFCGINIAQSAGKKVETKHNQKMFDSFKYINRSAPMAMFYSALQAQYSEKEVASFKKKLLAVGVTSTMMVPRVELKNDLLKIDGIKHPVKIVDAKNLKFSYRGISWEINPQKTPMENILSLYELFVQNDKVALNLFFPGAYAAEKSPMSTAKNLTYALGATALVAGGVAALAGGGAVFVGGAWLAAIAGSWALTVGLYWAGQEALERMRSGDVESVCVDGKLQFRMRGGSKPKLPGAFFEENNWLTAQDRETVARHLGRYSCKPSWVSQYLKSLRQVVGVEKLIQGTSETSQ